MARSRVDLNDFLGLLDRCNGHTLPCGTHIWRYVLTDLGLGLAVPPADLVRRAHRDLLPRKTQISAFYNSVVRRLGRLYPESLLLGEAAHVARGLPQVFSSGSLNVLVQYLRHRLPEHGGPPLIIPVYELKSGEVTAVRGRPSRRAHFLLAVAYAHTREVALWDGNGVHHTQKRDIQRALDEHRTGFRVVDGPSEVHFGQLQRLFEDHVRQHPREVDGRAVERVQGGLCATVGLLVLVCALRFGCRNVWHVSDCLVELLRYHLFPAKRHDFLVNLLVLLQRLLNRSTSLAAMAAVLGLCQHPGPHQPAPRKWVTVCGVIDPVHGPCARRGSDPNSPLCDAHFEALLMDHGERSVASLHREQISLQPEHSQRSRRGGGTSSSESSDES